MNSRRRFIAVAGASLAGLSSSSWARAAGALADAPRAIAESFVFDEWLDAMPAAIDARGNRGDRAFWSAFRPTGEAEHAAGTLLALPAPGVELFEAGFARDMAALANDRLAERVRASGGPIAGLATIAAGDPRAVDEAKRAMRLGLSGLALGANRAVRIDDRRLWPLYDHAQATGTAIYLPASYAPSTADAPYRALGRPGILAGAAADAARHANQLIFGGVLDAFPKLDIVLARLGEGAPYWHAEMGATYAAMLAAGASTPRHPADHYFETNIAMTTADVRSPATLAYCGGVIGRRKVFRSAHGDDRLEGRAVAFVAGPATIFGLRKT